MAKPSPRSQHHLSDRRAIVDTSEGDTQSGKIPIISETPRGEKANADLNPRFRGAAEKDRDYAEQEERDIG
jgi:hypothetical protein